LFNGTLTHFLEKGHALIELIDFDKFIGLMGNVNIARTADYCRYTGLCHPSRFSAKAHPGCFEAIAQRHDCLSEILVAGIT
jgi:hypothetical protein